MEHRTQTLVVRRGKSIEGLGLVDAEKCRGYAEHYLVRAQQTTNPAARAMMIDLAAQWLALAEQAARGKPITEQPQQVQPKKDEE